MNAPIFGTKPAAFQPRGYSRLAALPQGPVPQGAPNVAVGGCGFPVLAADQPGAPPLGVGNTYLSTPPPVGAPFLANWLSIIRQTCVPLGVIGTLPLGGATGCIEAAPLRGAMWIWGWKACNGCFEVILESVEGGGIGFNLIGSPFDIGTLGVDVCWCCFDAGCVTRHEPLRFCARSFDASPTTAPVLNLTLAGVRDLSLGCEPYIASYLAAALGPVAPGVLAAFGQGFLGPNGNGGGRPGFSMDQMANGVNGNMGGM